MLYRNDLDFVKGIAILGVVLFHLGIVKSGYLGVDAFLVINGFLIIPSILKKIDVDQFSYYEFIKKRVMRLWPMVVLVSLVCMVIGYIGMLPDDYENLGEAVVASNLFSENILLSITTRDYWNVNNDFNPLMHLWYVGIIFEFYLLFPLLAIGCHIGTRIIKSHKVGIPEQSGQSFMTFLFLIAGFSLIVYVGPWGTESGKFYYLPYRLFEFLIGGIVGLWTINKVKTCKKYSNQLYYLFVFLLIFVIFLNLVSLDIQSIGTDVRKLGGKTEVFDTGLLLPKQLLLLFTVGLTAIVIYLGSIYKGVSNRVIEYFGKRSYSIFIWHQLMIAFYRYFYSTKITLAFVVCFFVVLLVISELTYRLVEREFVKIKYSLLITMIMSFIMILFGGYIYVKAGVVRDVPELDTFVGNVHRGMHAEYVDRVYSYDRDFSEDNGKKNVLIQGNSYGRDMANVLLESSYKDSLNISYMFDWDEKYIPRIKKADYIFTFSPKRYVPDYLWKNMSPGTRIYGIGTKNFGNSNGIIYAHRLSPNYKKQTVNLHPWYKKTNDALAKEWGEDYINFIQLALTDSNSVRVFTDNGKYMSQDCYHLTKAGAQWYAKKIDFTKIFK